VTGDQGPQEWDIFISYAREDAEWVRGELYPALRSRRTAGGPPVIFLDTEREGIQPGAHWFESLARSVQLSRFFLPVYSVHYFASPMCRQELNWSMSVHAAGEQLIPIVIDSPIEVPFEYSQINWLSTRSADWLDRLCARIGLTGARGRPRLRFGATVEDVTVNHTLPEQRVELVDGHAGEPLPIEEQVTLYADPAQPELRGTLTAISEGGTATFRDLSFAAPASEVRLRAECPGCEPVRGEPFSVRGPVSDEPISALRSLVPDGDRILFFLADSQSLAAFEAGNLNVSPVRGERLAGAPLDDVPRLWARWEEHAAVAGWSGRVAVVDTTGASQAYKLGTGLAVPGALCPVDGRLYVGMWNGTVWALDVDSPVPERVFEHEAGVQAMAVADGRLLVADLDGIVTWYTSAGKRLDLPSHRLEHVLWDLWTCADCVIAIGARKVHRLDFESGRLLSLELPVTAATGALVESDLAAVFDGDGHGVRFDSQLAVRAEFRPPGGSRPIGGDVSGTVLVSAHPDGSHALMLGERVVFVNPSGPLAVSPDGRGVAFTSEQRGVTVMPLRELLARAALT